MKCFKPIFVKDKEFFVIPLKIGTKFHSNELYHIECYYLKKIE